MGSKKKIYNKNQLKDILKQMRKDNRDAEIKAYGKPLPRTKIQESKKVYKRDKRVDIDE